MRPMLDGARLTVNPVAAICIVTMLLTASQSSIFANSSSLAFCQDDASLKPGMYWTLSSKWRWSASGTDDEAGWRVESEDWNDTLSIQEVSGSELRLGLKRVGRGTLEASGSFIIGGLQSDSWKIDKQYSLKVDASTFRDPDGKPVRWVINVKGLNASSSVPQMWIDKNYRYVEVQFQASGSGSLEVEGLTFDTWAFSYANVTTGYWSAGGNHSTGFKEETLRYGKRYGLLLQNEYTGTYGMKTNDGGWNETETFVASIVDTNLKTPANVRSTSPAGITVLTLAIAVAVLIIAAVVLHKRKILAALYTSASFSVDRSENANHISHGKYLTIDEDAPSTAVPRSQPQTASL